MNEDDEATNVEAKDDDNGNEGDMVVCFPEKSIDIASGSVQVTNIDENDGMIKTKETDKLKMTTSSSYADTSEYKQKNLNKKHKTFPTFSS